MYEKIFEDTMGITLE